MVDRFQVHFTLQVHADLTVDRVGEGLRVVVGVVLLVVVGVRSRHDDVVGDELVADPHQVENP